MEIPPSEGDPTLANESCMPSVPSLRWRFLETHKMFRDNLSTSPSPLPSFAQDLREESKPYGRKGWKKDRDLATRWVVKARSWLVNEGLKP